MSSVLTPHPFLRWGLVLGGAAALAACSPDPSPAGPDDDPSPTGRTVAAAAGRPNIVVVMSDDQTVDDMRAMSRTRRLIGLAGVTFSNSVVTYALCCPSRATFLTGQYPHNHRVRNNSAPDGGYDLLDHHNTLPLWLQEAGYVTGHIGKYLNGYGDVNPLAIPPGYTEWYGSVGASAYRYYDYVVNENGVLVPHGNTPDQYQADVYTAYAVDFIRRRGRAAATGGKPFFLFVAYLAPHRNLLLDVSDTSLRRPIPAPRHAGRFAAEPLPRTPAFNESDMSDKPLSMRRRPRMSSGLIAEVEATYRHRLESLLAVDEGVARIVGALERSNVLATTLLIYTSDNGHFRGEHRIPFEKTLPYEPAVRVPLLVRGPGVTPGRQISAPVANVDLAATVLEAAGGKARRTVDGRSLWPLLQGQTDWPTPRHVMVEDSPRGTAATRFWSIRKGNYVYTEYDNGDRELYDLAKDSAQVASRHGDPAYTTIRTQLGKRLAAMKACAGPAACW
jgi:arylsulfatase A-like enzyme